MQHFPSIPADATITESRQLILDRDDALLSCFSGEQFPSTNLSEGMLCYRTDLQQLYQLKSLDGPSWHRIANLNETITSKEQLADLEERLADDIGAAYDDLNQSILELDQSTSAKIEKQQQQIDNNQVQLAEIVERCDTLDNKIDKQDDLLRSYIDEQILNIALPTGCIISYTGETRPDGWLECKGQAISRTSYAALFAILGETFGNGDGSTTFNLPDMRGRAPIGVGRGDGLSNRTLGGKPGSETHTLTQGQMPSHSHRLRSITGVGSQRGVAFGSGNTLQWGGLLPDTDNKGGGNPHNNMQPSLVLKFIIKV